MPYRLMFPVAIALRSDTALASCLRSDSSVIEKYVPALKFSSGEVTKDIKEDSEQKEMCLIWSNFEFAFREKLACLDIFYRVINVY